MNLTTEVVCAINGVADNMDKVEPNTPEYYALLEQKNFLYDLLHFLVNEKIEKDGPEMLERIKAFDRARIERWKKEGWKRKAG